MNTLFHFIVVSLFIPLAFILPACSGQKPVEDSPWRVETGIKPGNTITSSTVPVYGYNIIQAYPHDSNAFTQGLVYDNGFLYEGTGLYGQSSLRKVELLTGKALQIHELPARYFGEGITVYKDRIIQLTWQSNIGFVYDKNTFKLLRTFSYPFEGWGITDDGKQLIISDGTSILRFFDPETFTETGNIEVRDDKGPVARLNELEYVKGEIYANVWQTDYIVSISPDTGKVTGRIDLAGILASVPLSRPVDVLNGIAYDAKDERLFVTGKLWPTIFQIVPWGK